MPPENCLIWFEIWICCLPFVFFLDNFVKWLNALRHSALPWRRRFLSVCLCPFRCRCLSALFCSFYTVYFIVLILFHLIHCFLFLILFALCCSWPCKICWQTDTTSVFWLSSLTWLHTHTQSTQNTHSTRTHTHTRTQQQHLYTVSWAKFSLVLIRFTVYTVINEWQQFIYFF